MAVAESRPSRAPDWAAVRHGYPATLDRAYLDTACKGIPGSAAAAAVIDQVALLRDPSGTSATEDTVRMLVHFDRARSAAAALINAQAQHIALMPSTESGLAAIAASLRLAPGTNVVASDLDFVGTLLPWRSLERSRVGLKVVSHRAGRVEVEDLVAAIDRGTRAIVVSSVHEVNGARVDLDALAHACRANGVLLIVDAIQHVGPLTLDVAATPVDAVAAGGHKWLGAPFGMGFLYVSPGLIQAIEPPMPALMTAEPPPEGWSEYLESPARDPRDRLEFSGDARKLELGALGTTLAAAGLAAALGTLLEIGPHAIAARSAAMVEATVAAVEAAGAEIITPRDGLPSSIVTFRSSSEIDAERDLVRALASEGVLASLRFTTGVGGIRVAPYFYNDESDIDRLACVVATRIRATRR